MSQHPAVQSPVHPLESPMNLARSTLFVGSRTKKKAVVRHQLFPQKPPGLRLGARAQGFSILLVRRRSSCPPHSPILVRIHPIERYQTFRDSASCFSRAATRPERHQIGAQKRRAPGNTMLSQPYRRRVSGDRLNREGSQ